MRLRSRVLLVGLTLIGSACASPAPAVAPEPTALTASQPAVARSDASTDANLVLRPVAAAEPTPQPTAVAVAPASAAVPTVAPTPVPPPPEWVRSTRDDPLWSGPDDQAQRFGVLPANEYLKPLGPTARGRLLVYYAGDGGAHAPGQAWVDLDGIEPSGNPPWITTAERRLAKRLPAPPQRVSDGSPPAVTAASVAIIDDASGELLYGTQPHARLAPASITKIATTIVALERGELGQMVDVSISGSAMAARDGSSIMGLEPGERVSLQTLLYGMMLPSGNDAAEQVALTLGGSRGQYVDWMNQKVAELGLRDTHFVTPSGMDASGHYSSAYDMAMLARYAMHNADFKVMAAAATYRGDGYSFSNLNRLIGVYPGTDGVKIGFTGRARRTMVASVTRGGQRIYVGLMRSENLVGDSTAMLDWAFRAFTWK